MVLKYTSLILNVLAEELVVWKNSISSQSDELGRHRNSAIYK